MKQRYSWLLGTCLALLAGTVAAAQMVVVASTVPGISPGTLIDSTRTIEIPAGAQLTVIDQAGRTTRLSGPYSRPPGGAGGAGESKMLSSISKLLKGPEQDSRSLGAMRSAPRASPADPWSVDVTSSGTYCYPANGAMQLWRARSAAASRLTIANVSGGARVKTAWPAGQESLPWPGTIPLADGASYMARITGRATAAKLTMIALPKNLASSAHQAAWMADNGCPEQARRLLGVQ